MNPRAHVDLAVDFGTNGQIDLAVVGRQLRALSGRDNLIQSLKMRLLISRGELARLGHPRYGSRIQELIGEPLTRPNLELLRRHVRRAILSDTRVARILSLKVTPLQGEPSAVEVSVNLEPNPLALLGPAFEFGVILDVG